MSLHSVTFAMMNVKPSPLGVIVAASSSSSASVAVSGVASGQSESGSSPWELGRSVYTNTKGELVVSASSYYGSISSAGVDSVDGAFSFVSGSTNADYYYIFDEAQNCLLSLDSKIGLVVSTSQVLLLVKG
jgi:hypothetical protein